MYLILSNENVPFHSWLLFMISFIICIFYVRQRFVAGSVSLSRFYKMSFLYKYKMYQALLDLFFHCTCYEKMLLAGIM